MAERKKSGRLGSGHNPTHPLLRNSTKSPSFFLSFATIVPLLFHFESTKSFRFKFQVTIFLFLSPFVSFLYSCAARVISQIINQSRLTLTVCVLTELARNGERQLRKDGKANHPFRTRGSIVILVGGQFYLRTLFPILRGCPLTSELAVDILTREFRAYLSNEESF